MAIGHIIFVHHRQNRHSHHANSTNHRHVLAPLKWLIDILFLLLLLLFISGADFSLSPFSFTFSVCAWMRYNFRKLQCSQRKTNLFFLADLMRFLYAERINDYAHCFSSHWLSLSIELIDLVFTSNASWFFFSFFLFYYLYRKVIACDTAHILSEWRTWCVSIFISIDIDWILRIYTHSTTALNERETFRFSSPTLRSQTVLFGRFCVEPRQ